MSAGLASWAIEALAASTLLMVAVLVARGPVRRAFGPHIAYALWLLPVLRLLLPPMPASWREAAAAPIARATETMTILMIDPVASGTTSAAAPVIAQPLLGIGLGPLVVGFWAIGAAAFLLWHLMQHARFCRRILSAPASASEMAGGVRIVESEAASGPLAFGILRRYVAFPRDFAARYDDDERDLALAHELGHHVRGDLIANWVALAVLALHWFNPVAWRAFRAFRADQEMSNDAYVLAHRDPALRHAYGRAIVKSAHGGTIGATCHLHTINELKGRLKMLATTPKSRLRTTAGIAAIGLMTFAGLGVTASGTQAAERLKSQVKASTGIDIARLIPTPIAPTTPVAAIAPVVATTPTTPTTPTIPTIGTTPTTPTTPFTAVVPQVETAPEALPAPPAPPAPPAFDGAEDRNVVVTTDADGKVRKRVRIMVRDKDGKVRAENYGDVDAVMANMPEVSSMNCGEGGDRKQMVLNEEKGGKHKIIICTNRIERVARDGAEMAANSKDIERNAYSQALKGLRGARDRMANDSKVSGEARSEALAAMDESIAELQSDLAKVE